MLAAGLDGIKRGLTPPPPVNRNIYEMTSAEMTELGISSLPGNLHDSLELFKADPLVKATLGDHIYNMYYEFKNREWDDYRITVHPWEINEYLTKY
jgi:glutamine synthetase